MRTRLFLAVAALAVVVVSVDAMQVASPPAAAADRAQAVDKAFAAWARTTPGCAVGVSENGRSVLEKAYGMADLEHDVVNVPATIFEAGSVSKQFTAAAVLLLVKDGRIGLDDPVKKYLPELGASAAPVTIRHLLTHTSGLRDWGSLYGVAGVPRSTRVYTHAHVVEMLSRQTALNFAPGTRWSYSNSGYNLAAVIVARVSGVSFAEFSRTRLFEPLGLTRTSWRDDYARIVPGRAIAYEASGVRYRQDMPFENAHGNGGLLTTVGDLLKWNEAFATGSMSGAVLADQQWTVARLNDGRALHYGLGVFRGEYKGVAEVYHSGSTAGYRAFLTYYPSARLSVAVLCNAGNANATQLTRVVSDMYLGDRLRPDAPRTPVLREAQGPTVGLQRDATLTPLTVKEMETFVGGYDSAEIETMLSVEIANGALVIRRRPDAIIPLRPHSRDRFDAGAGLGLVTFHRTNGQIDSFSVTQDRVWDLRFTRRKGGGVIGPLFTPEHTEAPRR
jgi:CubicO group peptidase (beta-lactamase class C family)